MDLSHLYDNIPEATQQAARERNYKDFYYDESQDAYWDIKTGALISAMSVNGAIPTDQWETREDARGNGKLIKIEPAKTINSAHSGQRVESSTWWPGKDRFIYDYYPKAEGLMEMPGTKIFNQYFAPVRKPANGISPQLWIDHVVNLFGESDAKHFFDFAAHAVQRPDEKVNHGIVIAGIQGIGKDMMLLPLRVGVGQWNCGEIEPEEVMGQYTGFIRNVLLVINEIKPADSTNIAFYNKAKLLLAAAGQLISTVRKYENPIHIPNLVHVIMTTNAPLNMYIPEDDRRLYVMWSMLEKPFPESYFMNLGRFYDNGGLNAVVEWLHERDISQFNPKGQPPMTNGKAAIMAKTQNVQTDSFDEMLDRFLEHVCQGARPNVIFTQDINEFITAWAFDDMDELKKAFKTGSANYKLEMRGYLPVKPEGKSEFRNGPFRSKTAYVCKQITDKQAEIAKALPQRPLKVPTKQEKF